MSQFTKSLKTRIQELTASIEAQKAELTAYEQLVLIESAKGDTLTEESPSAIPSQTKPALPQSASVTPTAGLANITFTGNKTTLVTDIVKSFGSAGASPKDVNKVFTARRIKRGKNLIYNTLSYLVSQKKLQRRDGRYFGALTTPIAQTHSPSPTKRRLSPAGLKRIREGVKKRWAAQRAANRAAAK